MVLAAGLSWSWSHSILWAVWHAMFGWFSVIYFVVSGKFGTGLPW